MNQKNISLIISAFNEEKYIGDCLEYAIKNSQGKLLEIIVVDNASTDQTALIANKFMGVRVVREDKKGLTQARQCGFIEAKGDLLAYIDADTRMPKSWIGIIEKNFDKNQNLACLSGPYIFYDISSVKKFLVKIYWTFLALPSSYITGYMVVGGNFVIRKNILEKMNGFDTNIKFYGEDTNIARRAKEFGTVKFSLKFFMPTSARRLAGQGFIYTAYIYVINFLSEVFLHRPITSDYKDIR